MTYASLRPHMNLCRRRPIVFTFGLAQQHYAVIILQLESVFVLGFAKASWCDHARSGERSAFP